MATTFRTISTELVTDALEKAQIPQKALIKLYGGINEPLGWGVELALQEIGSFVGELVIAVAQEKAVSRAELDALDATVDVRRMLRDARIQPAKTERTASGRRWVAYPPVLHFPGWTLVD